MIIRSLKIVFFLTILTLSSCSSPPQGIIVFCAGDSITKAAYPRFLQRMFNKEDIRAKVLNYGRNGNNSGQYLNFLEKNKISMGTKRPDFILLQLGTNDVRIDQDNTSSDQFYKNMKKIIEIFRTFRNHSGKLPQIILSTIPPIPLDSPHPFSPQSNLRVEKEINPFIKKICNEEHLPLVDNYSLFTHSPHLLPEVHPSLEGYKQLAQNWYRTLKPFITNLNNL